MHLITDRVATPIETILLAATLFTLPLFEAPKNVLSLLFILVWIVQAIRTNSFGSSCRLNWPIWGLCAILWIAPLFSAYGDTITALNSAPRWTLLALFVIFASRLNYSRPQILIIWGGLLLGGTTAVVESLWIWHFNGKPYPEFRSVGHVNHSSMYTLITLAAGVGSIYVRYGLIQILGLLSIISTLVFLPASQSLVGGLSITAVLITALSVLTLRRWSFQGLIVATFVGLALVSVVLITPPAAGFRSELALRLTSDNMFSGRDKILNSALAVWGQHAFLGTGWFSFGAATSEDAVRAALEADGMKYDPNIYWHFPHGHNLWTTLLIERGLVGVTLITVLLFLYFWTFSRITFSLAQLDPVDRGAAVGALLTAVGFAVAGLGNTTMMNEHGHAGMAFIAVVYGYLRGRGVIQSNIRLHRI